MEIQREESLCCCWLVPASPAGSSWSWLMELSAVPRRGGTGLFSHWLKARLFAHNRWAPWGPWLVYTPPLSSALSILHLNQWTGPWAQTRHLQVTSVTVHLPKVARYTKSVGSFLCCSQVWIVTDFHVPFLSSLHWRMTHALADLLVSSHRMTPLAVVCYIQMHYYIGTATISCFSSVCKK